MNNFTFIDLTGIALAICLWSALATLQGMVLGYASNVMQFRARSLLRQFFLANVLSLAIVPPLYDLIAIFAGLDAIRYLNGAFVIAAANLLLTHRRRLARLLRNLLLDVAANRAVLCAVVACFVLAIPALVDLQVGDKLYLSLTMHDHSHKVGVVESILRDGLPPPNPCFYPGRTVPFFWHYYWTLICAVVNKVSGGTIDNRLIVLAGAIWSSVSLVALIEVAGAFFRTRTISGRRLTLICELLLLVSNLYVMIDLPINLVMHPPPIIDLVWWSRDGFSPVLLSMMWLPHNVASLVAGVFGSLLLIDRGSFASRKQFAVAIVFAGFSLASSFGLCTFVGFTFGLTWIVWTIACALRRRPREFAIVTVAALLSLLLVLPFLTQFKHSNTHKFPLKLGLKSFELVYLLPALVPPKGSIAYKIMMFCTIPLNYIFGFGFTFTSSFSIWARRRFQVRGLESKYLFPLLFTLTSLFVSTFIRSSSGGNDFGWRSILLAQFGFLVCSAFYLAILKNEKRKLSFLNQFMIAMGIASSVYAIYLDRDSYRYLFDAERSCSTRMLYDDLAKKIPTSAVVQHNPTLLSQFPLEVLALSYSHHRMVCSEKVKEITGPQLESFEEYQTVASDVVSLFDAIPAEDALKICRKYKINYLVVKDTDKIWKNPDGWIWKFPVIAQNAHARAVQVIALPPE